MANLSQVGKGKISLKFIDQTNEGFTENFAYSAVDFPTDTDASVSTSLAVLNAGLNAVADLLNATLVTKRVSYDYDISN